MSDTGSIRIDKVVDPYARIQNRILCDQRLSYRARGIFAYLISKPHNWEVRMSDVIARGTEGRDAVRAAFKELAKFGYAKLNLTSKGSQWVITDKPGPENPSPETQALETRRRISGPLNNTDLQTTEYKQKRENVNGSLFPEIKRVGKRPTLMELKAYCSEKGLTPRDAEWLDAKWEGNGFKNNGKPITSWRGTISQWQLQKDIFPSQKEAPKHQGNCI